MKLRALQLSLVGLVASTLVFALATSGTGQEPAAKQRKVVKTDAEWRKLLTREQYMVTRQAGTEPAFTGKLTEQPCQGDLRVRLLRDRAVQLEDQVRIGHRLAQLLRAARREEHRYRRPITRRAMPGSR